MQMQAERIFIKPLELKDIKPLLDLRIKNKNYLKPFEPILPAHYFTMAGQEDVVKRAMGNWENDLGYSFGICLPNDGQIIGVVNLSNIVRGAWQNCNIGYFIDKDSQGKSFTTQAVTLVLQFAFEEANLHRVEAAIMPRNVGSIRVVEKTGFNFIGLSKNHLKINGHWEDHCIYAITMD
jgi:[ribosomal protein S5]-alanine N-acetyltransferase